MYDKIFNLLAVLTLVGVGFIACATPYLTEPAKTEETPLGANLGAIRALHNNADGIKMPDPSPAFEAKATKEAAKAVIDNVLALEDVLDSIEVGYYKKTYVGEFYLTKYAATVEQCGNDLGITASGRKVTDDPTCHTVAVDPAIIPLGSYLIIEGYEGIVFRADDTGSAINGYDIDIFTTSESESKTFNNVSGAKVWIIKD